MIIFGAILLYQYLTCMIVNMKLSRRFEIMSTELYMGASPQPPYVFFCDNLKKQWIRGLLKHIKFIVIVKTSQTFKIFIFWAISIWYSCTFSIAMDRQREKSHINKLSNVE